MRYAAPPILTFAAPSRNRSGAATLRLFLCFLLVSSATAACAGGDHSGNAVLVMAAASTIDALEAAVGDFEARTGIDVEVSFGPTSTVARQIEEGAPAALMLSASREWADYVQQRVAIRRRETLVSNQLVVIKPTRPVDGVAGSLRDFFEAPGRRRFAVADPESVPAGIYTRQALEALGLWESLEPRLVPTVDVRAALALVARDEVDGGIVYATDARANDVVTVGRIDPMFHEPIEYPLLLLDGAGSEATELFDFLVSAAGLAHFFDRGFINPDG